MGFYSECRIACGMFWTPEGQIETPSGWAIHKWGGGSKDRHLHEFVADGRHKVVFVFIDPSRYVVDHRSNFHRSNRHV